MSTRQPEGVTRTTILDYLIHEADLDGVVIVSCCELAGRFGVTSQTAAFHVRTLVSQGLLRHEGHSQGVRNYSINVYRLAEELVP